MAGLEDEPSQRWNVEHRLGQESVSSKRTDSQATEESSDINSHLDLTAESPHTPGPNPSSLSSMGSSSRLRLMAPLLLAACARHLICHSRFPPLSLPRLGCRLFPSTADCFHPLPVPPSLQHLGPKERGSLHKGSDNLMRLHTACRVPFLLLSEAVTPLQNLAPSLLSSFSPASSLSVLLTIGSPPSCRRKQSPPVLLFQRPLPASHHRPSSVSPSAEALLLLKHQVPSPDRINYHLPSSHSIHLLLGKL